MTRYEQITAKIDANTDRLLRIYPRHSKEALKLREEQTELLTRRLNMTPSEAQEEV